MDLFADKRVEPMLIGASQPAFDSPDYIYELKLDGIRCVAYLDQGGTYLSNKRLLNVTALYPELAGMHSQVSDACVLDGELCAMVEGKPNFSQIQRRSLMGDRFKIALEAKRLPLSYVAFDILYRAGEPLTDLPLAQRKRILAQTVARESDRLIVARYVAGQGVALYNLTVDRGLEGIVAKRVDSRYYPGKRTRDWIKCKNLLDEDFSVCGYIQKEGGVVSVVLGQLEAGRMRYRGHVTLGVSGADFAAIRRLPRLPGHPFEALPPGNERAQWVAPMLTCTVAYMEKTPAGSMRQPVFKGIRSD